MLRSWKIIAILYALVTLTVVILHFKWEEFSRETNLFGAVNYSHQNLLIGFAISYFLLSFNTVRETEIAILIILGKPLCKVKSGLCVVPLGICWLDRYSKQSREVDWPANRKDIWRGEGDIPDGKVPPFRVVTGDKNKEEERQTDPESLDVRMVLEPSGQVLYSIEENDEEEEGKEGVIQFLEVVGSFEKADQRMIETILATVKEEYGIRTPAKIVQDAMTIDKEISIALKKLVGAGEHGRAWGVKIDKVVTSENGLPRRVSESLADVGKSLSDRRTLANLGRGQGEAISNNMALSGITDGMALQQMNTAERIMAGFKNNPNLTFVSGSGEDNNLVHLVAKMATVAKSTPGTNRQTTPPPSKQDPKPSVKKPKGGK